MAGGQTKAWQQFSSRSRPDVDINECGGIIDFNGILYVGSFVTLLLFWPINRYSCHLWGAHLIYVVVIYHMDDTGLMDNGDFSSL